MSRRRLIHPRSLLVAGICAGLVAAGCSSSVGGTTVKRNGLPLKFDFSSDCNGFDGTEGGATSVCRNGEFHVSVVHPSADVHPQQDYLFRFDDSTPGLAVSADVRLEQGDPGHEASGVACVASQYRQPGQEYVFAISNEYAGIFRRDETLNGPRMLRQLDYARVPGMQTTSTNHIEGECAVLSSRTTLLVMRVNGREVLREYTRTRFPRFVATSLWMITMSGGSFAFDNLSAREETRTG